MTITLADAITRHGVSVDDHHDLDSIIPVLTGVQFQGDVAVIPIAAVARKMLGDTVPPTGIAVVRGENGGNTHLLLADGTVTWQPAPARTGELALGTLSVASDATAYLAHPEHAYSGIGPGVYELRRQREQADAIRMVAD